jgi:DltD-like protein
MADLTNDPLLPTNLAAASGVQDATAAPAPAVTPAPAGRRAPAAPPSGPPRPRRAILRQLGVLLLLLVALDVITRVALEPLVLSDPTERDRTLWHVALYHQTPAPVDVLVMGSSRVQLGLSPVLMMNELQTQFQQPVHILNLGMKLATPQANYWMLKNIVQPDKQPRVIIYGAAEYEFNEYLDLPPTYDYRDELATLSDYSQAFPDPTQRIDDQLSFFLGRPWYLFRMRNVIRSAVTERDDPGASTWPGGIKEDPYGFVPADGVMDAGAIARMRGLYVNAPGWGLLKNYTIGGPMVTRFEQFLQLAKDRGIQVIVLNMPVAKVHETFLPPAAYAAYRAYLQQTAAKYGMTYADYNNHALWQEPQDFRDTNHLNNRGAAKLSPMVTDQMLAPALRALGWK